MDIIKFLTSLPEGMNAVDKLVLIVLLVKPNLKNKEMAVMLDISERTIYRSKLTLNKIGIGTDFNNISEKENLSFFLPKNLKFPVEKRKQDKLQMDGQYIPYEVLFNTLLALEESEKLLSNVTPRSINVSIVRKRIMTIGTVLKGYVLFSSIKKWLKK